MSAPSQGTSAGNADDGRPAALIMSWQLQPSEGAANGDHALTDRILAVRPFLSAWTQTESSSLVA
jgi:hypothetical protein